MTPGMCRGFSSNTRRRAIEARTRNLGFPAISLREWKMAQKALRQKGRGERDNDQLPRTALAQRQIVADAIANTAAARDSAPSRFALVNRETISADKEQGAETAV